MFDLYADHCKFPDEERETARKRFGAFLSRAIKLSYRFASY